nr:hypothetical protein KK1_012588 [Cajanus cajan]
MPKYKLETQVQIVCATMAIHNFIRRNAESDIDFSRYEDENITFESDDNYHGTVNLEKNQVLNVISSSKMDQVRDSIRDEIVQLKNKH